MAAQPYTVRLLSGRGSSVNAAVEVPPGYRALLSSVTFAAWTTPGQAAFVWAAGDVVAYWAAPGANAVVSVPVRGVAYAGEIVRITSNVGDMGFHLVAMLLKDDGSGPRFFQRDLGALEPGELDAPWQTP